MKAYVQAIWNLQIFLQNSFAVRTALIAHYCIKGGMTSEKSYSIRDYYIMKTDKCKTESEIRTVHRKMIESYTNKMRHIKLRGVYSKQIVRALDYIIGHLYQRIFIKETAEYLKISPAYLSGNTAYIVIKKKRIRP